MSGPLERVAELTASAVAASLPDATIAAPVVLPRGADPFSGVEWPVLLTATRWTAVSPGGVLVGGSPDAVAEVLGFQLPQRPVISPENAAQHRRASDTPADPELEVDGGGVDASSAPTDDAEETPAPADDAAAPSDAAPASDAPADDAPASGEAAPAGEPVRARRWTDRVADASREPAAQLADDVIRALADLVGLPHGVAATQATYAEGEASVAEAVGPLPDAVVVPVQRGGAEVRLVVVVPGIVCARIAASVLEVGSAAGPGAAPVAGDGELSEAVPPVTPSPALSGVPLDLAAEIGTTRLPLSSVLGLREGAVVELSEGVDAPVALVAGSTTVAAGELELDDAGALVLHVTTIPGRPDLARRPSLVGVADHAAGAPQTPAAIDVADEPLADVPATPEPAASDDADGDGEPPA